MMLADTYLMNEPPSLEFLCLEAIRTSFDSLEPSREDGNSFIHTMCNLPGPLILSIFEILGKSGTMSDFKLEKLFGAANSNSTPMKSLHLYDINDRITVLGLLHYSCYTFEDIVLKFDRNNKNQPSFNELWQTFNRSENSLQVLKLMSYSLDIPAQDHVFSFASRFPNLTSFCIHTFSENFENASVYWEDFLDSCQSLEEVEIFAPKSKEHFTLDTSLIIDKGKNITILRLPGMLSYSIMQNSVLRLNGLLKLDGLSCLDISVDIDPGQSSVYVGSTERRKDITDFMEQLGDEHVLPNLASLDLSGWREVHSGHVRRILTSHSRIEFLGLCLLDIEYTNDNSVAESVNVSIIIFIYSISFTSVRKPQAV